MTQAATYAQVQYLKDLAVAVHGDEYWLNEHLGISRSWNLTKKLTKQQASDLIDQLKTAKEEA